MNYSLSVETLQLVFDTRLGFSLLDKSTGQKWNWPIQTLCMVQITKDTTYETKPFYGGNRKNDQISINPMDSWTISEISTDEAESIKLAIKGNKSIIMQTWKLNPSGLRVKTEVKEWGEGDDVKLVSPGIVNSANHPSPALISIYQGLLHHEGNYCVLIKPGSHGNHQQGVAGLLGKYGGLSMIVDLSWEYDLYLSAKNSLDDSIGYLPIKTFGKYENEYTTYYKIAPSSVFGIGKSYRDFKIGRGQFKTWDEKLKTTPGLEKMFGAAHFFIGYFQSSHDYVEALRTTKEMGFDRGFVYPAAFRTYHPNTRFREENKFINLEEKILEIKELGYHVAPWSWPEEMVIGPESEPGLWGVLGADEKGEIAPGWEAGEYTWYKVAGDAQVQFMKWAEKNMWPELTAQHFDVTGNVVNPHIFGNKEFNRSLDVECRQNLLNQAAELGPVSTEGFCDGYISSIHCGSVIAYPSWGDKDWWTVPLNSIVYHDSAMNVWWEADSYNNPYHQTQSNRDMHVVPAGGGKPIQQSLLDALQGTPPNIFLCGRMYCPSDGVAFGKGYEFYEIGFSDEITQQSLALARPIVELHRKVGKEQIVDFQFLTKNGQVQRTVFKDGTTVTVNFGKDSWTDGTMVLKGESWTTEN